MQICALLFLLAIPSCHILLGCFVFLFGIWVPLMLNLPVLCVQEERIRRGDDLRLQMALEESKKEGPDSVKLPKKKKEVRRVHGLKCPSFKIVSLSLPLPPSPDPSC